MPLLNAFIDSVVCVGFTSERGVAVDPESKNDGSLFTSFLQPSVLAIVTADRAMYPQSRGSEFIDALYPPVGHSTSHSMTASSANSDHSTSLSSVSLGLRTQIQHMISAAFNNLPLFCFPDGVQATYQRENERIHHVVFTQEDGKRSYAMVLTFQQPFTLKTNKPDDDGIYQIDDIKQSTLHARRRSVSRIPIPIDKQKVGSPVSSPSPTASVKTPSKKMPKSFPFPEPSRSSRSRSIDPSKKHHYETHTISSSMKSPATAGTPPPPSRMVRTPSQNNLKSPTDPSSNSIQPRGRTNSIVSQTSQLSTASSTPTPPDITKPFFLPHCLVLVSSQPYWTAMQETISIIHDEITQSRIEPSSKAYKQLIQKYAFLACNTPIPPIPWERFSLAFSLTKNQSVLTFDPPINTNRTVLDLDLSMLLLTLNIGKLLDVLAAIFTQQPIIFFSSNYSKLVTTLECLLYLIYPLKWINVYVPLVPNGLRDHYLEGPPGSYIMGTHSRHQSIVEELDFSLTCNLDNDKNIYIPKNIKFHHIPSTKLQRFTGPITQFLEEIKVARASQNVHTPIRLRIDQQREFERQQRIEINQKITKIFLDLMVDLCGDALKPIYWKVNQSLSPTNTLTRSVNNDGKNSNLSQTTIFSKEKYLLSKTEGIELEFYREFVGSSAFQILMEEETPSSTSPTIFRQICQIDLLSNEDQLYHVNFTSEDSENIQNGFSTTLCDSVSSPQMLLPLPNWPSNTSTYYLDSCIEVFTSELQNAQEERSPAVIAVYAYLRGCALLAQGNLIDGLRDLYLIENPNLFPRDYIETTIIPRLADECLLDTFLHEKFYTNSPEWKKVHTRSTLQRMSSIDLNEKENSFDGSTSIRLSTRIDANNEFHVVENALTYEQFSEHVNRLSIVLDKETTETLFNALLYWTDNTITKTSKKTKTLTNNTNKSSEALKPLGKSQPTTNNSLKDTLTMLIDDRRGNSNATLSSKSSNSSLPATLFESFLDIWQQTNAEKVRMIRCLPEDRQKQESILKVSTSDVVSKKDGPGHLILTQKRLYFLPEARSFARLLTELMNIISVDKYQHQTVFSSSKPGIKIHTSSTASTSSLPRDSNLTLKSKSSSLDKESKSSTLEKESKLTISLFFQNNRQQELWYTLIIELWSGLTIAHEQCDTTVLSKASRQIALMDTLANIDYDEETMSLVNRQLKHPQGKSKQHHNEASLEMALNDLSTFTRMRQTGTYKPLSTETRNVLTRRLSPSINETERHTVRCLVFIKHPENGRSSLWCTYGSKLKVFNVTTWICDPSDILFPSTITCMCLDARYKLWVGCIHGQLFVVDTLTRTCGPQLALIDGEGGCEAIAFDVRRNHILTATRSSSITLWNASNWERLNHINLCEIYKATNNEQQKTFKSEAVITFRNTTGSPNMGKNQNKKPTFQVVSNDQMDIPNIPLPSGPAQVTPSSKDKLQHIQIYEDLLFACYRDDYILVIRISNSNTYTYEHLISVKYKTGDSTPIDSFLAYNKQLWISAGCIVYIFNINNSNNEDSYNLLMKKPVDDDHLITMLGFSGYLWAGSLRGNVYVFRMDNYELYKTFAGHRDSVCCLCPMLDMYVVSGSALNDTSIAIWENVQTSNGKAASLLSSEPTTNRSTFSMNGTSNTSRIPKINFT